MMLLNLRGPVQHCNPRKHIRPGWTYAGLVFPKESRKHSNTIIHSLALNPAGSANSFCTTLTTSSSPSRKP